MYIEECLIRAEYSKAERPGILEESWFIDDEDEEKVTSSKNINNHHHKHDPSKK